MIWERAVSKVARELGISDVALRKKCIAHAIPLPDAVYWGKRNAGKPVVAKPLRPAPAGVSEVITIATQPKAFADVRAALRQARTDPSERSAPVVKSSLVRATIAAAKRKAPDYHWGAIRELGPEHFQIRAHPDTLDRLEGFLNLLAAGVKERKWRFAPGKTGLDVVVDDEPVGFAVIQTIRRARHTITPEEQRVVDRWDARNRGDWRNWEQRPTPPFYDFTPTGEMRFEISGWPHPAGVPRQFVDTRNRKLEDRIGEILVSFAAHSAEVKAERERAVFRARDQELARLERERLAHLAALEQARLEWLECKLAEQVEVEAIERFVERLMSTPGTGDSWAVMTTWAQAKLAEARHRLSGPFVAGEIAAMPAFAALPDGG